jgi:hypothetical protein
MELSRRDFLYLSGGAVLGGAPATERFTQLDLFPAGAEGYASYRAGPAAVTGIRSISS